MPRLQRFSDVLLAWLAISRPSSAPNCWRYTPQRLIYCNLPLHGTDFQQMRSFVESPSWSAIYTACHRASDLP